MRYACFQGKSRQEPRDNSRNGCAAHARAGIARVSVEELSGAVGLTQGSLYNHFGSKDALAAAAVCFALKVNAEYGKCAPDLETYIAGYLTGAPCQRTDDKISETAP